MEKVFKKTEGLHMVEFVVYKTKHEQPPARLAAEFISRWGMVAAVPDGEDSAGRSKLRLATPEEIVTRGCETAAALWEEFQKRGWLLDFPAPSEETEEQAFARLDEQEARRQRWKADREARKQKPQ